MASPGTVLLDPQDQKDLEKYTKYLAVKAVQVVVQARTGDRVMAPSMPDTSQGTSWFNLAVRDNSEVMQETKRALGGQVPSPGLPLVCEISLKTSEGDSLVLELWRLAVVAGGDPGVKVTNTVYNRMSLLLKSLVTVARVTPAYRLSRRQGQDSYVICFRVSLGDPHHLPDLGEGALTAKVGQVTTPTSTIVCCVDYRTNMAINQQKPGSAPILVKSDHFTVGLAPGLRGKHRLSSECISDSDPGAAMTSDESAEATRMFATSPLDREGAFHRPRADSGGSVSSQDRFRVGAFAGPGAPQELPSLEEELSQEPLLHLLPRPRPPSTVSVQSGEVSNTSAGTDTETQFLMSSDSGSKVQLGPQVVGLEKPKLCQKASLPELLGKEERQGLGRRPSGGSLFGTTEVNNDFVMVDLKTPFAAQASTEGQGTSSTSDPTLGSFFKEVSAAPSLHSLSVAPTIVAQAYMWSSQLLSYQESLAEYDDLLNQMGSGSEAEQET